jgi:predicted RNA-binding protein with PUA domain|tara:strand:- start:45 stop:344 length:300 start_codon:yes stop_codon:yes gene_type:complete
MDDDYGMRHNPADGKKYTGWKGIHINKEGKKVTEHSMGFGMNGKEVEIPMIVPSTTKEELDIILNGKKVTPAMIKKATDHAKQRMAQGKSPFKNLEDDE